jgi:hypothetical protein
MKNPIRVGGVAHLGNGVQKGLHGVFVLACWSVDGFRPDKV